MVVRTLLVFFTDKPIARSHATVGFRPAFASFSLFFGCVLSHPWFRNADVIGDGILG